MVLEKKANAEPIPGYRLLELLGNGGFGEVWKCEAPGGIYKAIKFVYGNMNGLSSVSRRAENELHAVQHIKSIRHPFLLSIDRLECIQGELIIVTELADKSLHDLLKQYQGQGQLGMPRAELLYYLRETAEVLDMLNGKFNLQHLDVKPRNIFLVGNHVKVADFGLVQSLSLGQASKVHLEAITPLYAAPEIFQGMLSRHCDQYSLAIVYQELLTGTMPFVGNNTRQLLLQHTKAEPALSPLPAVDRAIVAKALNKNFNHRFGSCLEFVQALVAAQPLPAGTHVDAPPKPDLPDKAIDDTQVPAGRTTVKWRASLGPRLPAGVLPGYRFLESMVNSPLVETWKAQAPDDKNELVHLIYGFTITEPHKMHELAQRLGTLQHPGLVPANVVHAEPGRIIMTVPAVAESMRDRWLQCQKLKQPGIMRNELIDFIRAAAEILDYLYQQHSVQHLGLNPRTLLLDKGWLQLAEFGLNQLVWLPSGQDIAQRNVNYAAPELFQKQPARSSDQYSLAIIYAEMLTGRHPFHGQDPRNRKAPDLEGLRTEDRAAVARALDADPAQRWPSAVDMIHALEGTLPQEQQQVPQGEDSFAKMLKQPRRIIGLPKTHTLSEDLHGQIADLIASVGGQIDGVSAEPAPVLSAENQILEHRFQVCVPLGSTHEHIEPFLAELGGQLMRHEESCYMVSLVLAGTLWQRMRRREPTVEVRIDLSRVHPMSPTPVEVKVSMCTHNLPKKQALEILEKNGPAVLERLRKHVLVGSEKRMQDRLLWPHTLQVVPVNEDGELQEPIECRGKDISFSGMGLYLPHEVETREVILHIANSVHPPILAIPATLVRAHRCADGWYRPFGAMFHLPSLKKSLTDALI